MILVKFIAVSEWRWKNCENAAIFQVRVIIWCLPFYGTQLCRSNGTWKRTHMRFIHARAPFLLSLPFLLSSSSILFSFPPSFSLPPFVHGNVMVRACDSRGASSTPDRSAVRYNDRGQVVHTHVPLSPSSINLYRSQGSDVLRLRRCYRWLFPPCPQRAPSAFQF